MENNITLIGSLQPTNSFSIDSRSVVDNISDIGN